MRFAPCLCRLCCHFHQFYLIPLSADTPPDRGQNRCVRRSLARPPRPLLPLHITAVGGLCFLKTEETFLHEGFPKLHELLEKSIPKGRSPTRCSPSFFKNGHKIHKF